MTMWHCKFPSCGEVVHIEAGCAWAAALLFIADDITCDGTSEGDEAQYVVDVADNASMLRAETFIVEARRT